MQTTLNATRRAAGIFLRIALLSGLLAAFSLPALAQTPYVDAKGQPQSSPVIATPLIGNETTLNTGWYLCNGPLSYTGTIIISGDVNLILGDGCDMNVTGSHGSVGLNESAGIHAVEEHRLTIWAQSTTDAGMGSLTVTSARAAGIGGGGTTSGSGTITINGGRVNASGVFGAGIGSGVGGAGGTITINGGRVNASGRNGGAGIGGGSGFWGGTVIINGGTVNATGGSGAGIGGGFGSAGGVIDINGGRITATGGSGAGIGGGFYGAGGTITINGGRVNATGGGITTATDTGGGAGIGGGEHGDGGTIEITNKVDVIAKSIGYGAGIGSGRNGAGGSIRITGRANVTAKGDSGGAGIGGGLDGDAGRIIIATSGRVQAKGGTATLENNIGIGANIGLGGDKSSRAGAGISPISKPADTAVTAGGNATFRVKVARTAHWIAYQWQQSSNGGKNWSSIKNTNRATLNLSGVTASMNGNLYRCVVRVWGIGKESSITYTTAPARLTVRQ